MDQFDPDSITPEQLSLYRQAAESAWGDDTRHPNYVGHPKPSAGQCYVTSAWLQGMLGGHVGGKGGHFFWVSPTRSHVIDLTGDQFHGDSEIPTNPIHVPPRDPAWAPEPVHYERADHPFWKGFRLVPEKRDLSKNPRVRIFSQRANAALNGQKLADGGAAGSDPYPGETPEKIEQMNQLNFHDEPDYEPEATPRQFNFVWANGQLHVSPSHTHEQLLGHSGADPASEGPTAVGYADVAQGHVTWRVESNVGLHGLRDALAHYSHQIGWKFDGLVGTDGQPMGLDLGPIMSFWYRENGDNIQISKTPMRGGKRIEVTGSTAWVKEASHPGLVDWAGDRGIRLAEYPGDTDMTDRMRNHEDLSQFNNADPGFQPERQNLDEEPGGPFVCPQCGYKPKSFGEYKIHMDDHQPKEDVYEDGHFPQVQDFDEPLGFGTQPGFNAGNTIAMVTTRHEAKRIPEFELYSNLFGFQDTDRYYGAYRNGELLGYGVVRESTQDWRALEPEVQDRLTKGNPWAKSHDCGETAAAWHQVLQENGIPAKMMLGSQGDHDHAWLNINGEPFDPTPHLNPGIDLNQGYEHTPNDTDWPSVAPYRTAEVLMIQSAAPGIGTAILEHIKRHYSQFYSHADTPAGEALMRRCGMVNVKGQLWRYSAGNEPKDMIEADVPFVYDIQHDKLVLGYAGSSTHDVRAPGGFTPGGIVEGYYQPGGKVIIQTAATWPFSVRHLIDLWYWTAPQMEVTSVEQVEQDGSNTKLAAWGQDTEFRYHGTYEPERIMNEGLRAGAPESMWGDEQPKGVYLTFTPEEAKEWGPHVVEVDISGLPRQADEHSNGDIIQHDIPPERIRPLQLDDNVRTSSQEVGQYIRTLLQSDVAAEKAYKALRDAGGKVYAVGGAPRDALQGKVPNDIDLMVAGVPSADVEHILSKLPGNVTFAGKNFGVFHYHVGGDTVEIALPRSDSYEGDRRSDGKITVDPDLPIADDLHRRDFTANSTAVDLDTGELIDPHGGASDIQRGVLRTTHADAFREDPSRLVRALTMHGRFNLTPDEQTRHEMESNAHLLRGESPDLLNKVFTKTMGSDNPASAIRLAHDTGLLQHLLPEVHDNWDFDQNNPHHNYKLGEHLLHVLDNVSRLTTDPDVRMAALMHDVGKPASAWVNPETGKNHYYQGEDGQGANHEDVGAQMTEDRLRGTFNYQSARIHRIRHLVQNHMFAPFVTPKGARKFIQRVGDEHADDLLNLREADQTGKGQTPDEVAARTSANQMRDLVEGARSQQAPTDVSALSLNGNDLIQMGMKPGPAIGQVLRYLTDEVVNDPMANQRDRLMELADSYIRAQPPEALA